MAVNASILVGYRMAGVPGALVTVGGTVLPPLIIISVISLFYQAFRANPIVNLAMTGMLAGVAAVLCDVVYTMARSVLRPGKWVLPAVLMVLSFLAVAVGGWNPILVLLLCGGVGAVQLLAPGGRGRGGAAAVIYLELLWSLSRSACSASAGDTPPCPSSSTRWWTCTPG